MSDAARNAILGRLRRAPSSPPPSVPAWTPPAYGGPEARLERFTAMLESFHAEVHAVEAEIWPERLCAILANKGVRRLMMAPRGETARRLAACGSPHRPELVPYDRPVEEVKPLLVSGVDAAVTTTLAGIAETGSLVLWPDPDEPRLLSLLPPVHVALVREETLVDNLAGLMESQGWAGRMPTNALLISGPSKTADIEQTLAYGVHGPKELIVLVLRGRQDSAP